MNAYQARVLEFMTSNEGMGPEDKAVYLSEVVHDDVPGVTPATKFFGTNRGRTAAVSKGHAQRWLDHWIKKGELCDRGQELAVEYLELTIHPKTLEITFRVKVTVTPEDSTAEHRAVAHEVAQGVVDECSYATVGDYYIEEISYDLDTVTHDIQEE